MFQHRRNCPVFGEEELNAIKACLDTGMVARAGVVSEFEQAFLDAGIVDAEWALALNSCTSALYLALRMLQRRDKHLITRVYVSDFTFVATANACIMAGLNPIPIDVDLETYNMDINDLLRKIDENGQGYIMPVHCFGNPVYDFIDETNLGSDYIIEDAACAVGSDPSKLGFGTLQCWSFHGSKVITTGIGGMLTGDDPKEYEWAKKFARNGRPVYDEPAFNFQISNLNAAMGIEQLKRLPEIVEIRKKRAKRYNYGFKAVDGLNTQLTDGSNYQSYVITVENHRDDIINELQAHGIEAVIGTYSMSRLPYIESKCPNGSWIFDHQICLPLYPMMTDEDQKFIIDQTIKTVEWWNRK